MKINTKAFIPLILAILCAFSLYGCSSKDSLSFPDREESHETMSVADLREQMNSGTDAESSISAPAEIVSKEDLQNLYDNMVTGVWVTATGSKYHSIEKCGTTKTSRLISLEEAEELGYEPCSKCCD